MATKVYLRVPLLRRSLAPRWEHGEAYYPPGASGHSEPMSSSKCPSEDPIL